MKLVIRHKYSFLGIESSRARILDTVFRMIRNTHVTTKESFNVNDDLFPELAVFKNNFKTISLILEGGSKHFFPPLNVICLL